MSSAPSSFSWSSASRSHPGCVRQINEDACLEQSVHGLWAVADGMGGHTLGEYASCLAVQSLKDLPASADLEQRVEVALGRLREVNCHLRAEALRRDVPLIGTTIAALLAVGNLGTCLWAGDSRIYLYRDNHLRLLTRDHNQIEAVRSRPVADLEDTVELPKANFITRALGAEETLRIEQVSIELLDEDIFLLCTDGLSNLVTELAIEQALLPGSCRMACDALIGMALEREARDNVTAVVVHAADLSNPERTILRMR